MLSSFSRSPKSHAISTFTLIALLSGGVAVRAQVGKGRVGVKPLPGAEVMVKQAPVAIGKVKSAQPAKVEPVRVAALLAITQISAGQLTPQQAWEQDLLNANDILQLLSQPRRLTQVGSNEDLKRDLAGLLVRYAPATVATPDTLSARVRLELGIYYSSIGDARAVPLCEALISEKLDGQQTQMPKGKESEPDDTSLWLRSVIALAQFYENTEQWQKAGETWERALTFWQDEPGWQASIRLDAARAYKQIGTPENYDKAKQLYLQAARSSNALYAGNAILAGFNQELKSNPEQAQKELLQLQKEDINPEAQLATQFLLAWARYKAGDWNAFLLQSQQVLTQYESIKEQSRRQSFALLALQLEEGQEWAKLWQKSTIVAEQPGFDLRFDRPLEQPVERRIFVDTPTPMQLQVTVEGDTDRVSAHLEASPWAPELQEVRYQQIIVVTIKPGVAQIQSLVRVAEINSPQGAFQIPIKVTLPH